ncbi:hypothetical protein JCM18549_11770 [Halolamina salina]
MRMIMLFVGRPLAISAAGIRLIPTEKMFGEYLVRRPLATAVCRTRDPASEIGDFLLANGSATRELALSEDERPTGASRLGRKRGGKNSPKAMQIGSKRAANELSREQ